MTKKDCKTSLSRVNTYSIRTAMLTTITFKETAQLHARWRRWRMSVGQHQAVQLDRKKQLEGRGYLRWGNCLKV